jgi:protein LTV1
MEKEYGEEDDDDEGNDNLSDDSSDSAPDLITTREDFEAMMDDFLDNYELLGRKMKPVLPGDSGVDKLNTLRRALGQDERVRIGIANEEDDSAGEILMPYEQEDKEDRWDCETILSGFQIQGSCLY